MRSEWIAWDGLRSTILDRWAMAKIEQEPDKTTKTHSPHNAAVHRISSGGQSRGPIRRAAV